MKIEGEGEGETLLLNKMKDTWVDSSFHFVAEHEFINFKVVFASADK
jgi:hypothetical protein